HLRPAQGRRLLRSLASARPSARATVVGGDRLGRDARGVPRRVVGHLRGASPSAGHARHLHVPALRVDRALRCAQAPSRHHALARTLRPGCERAHRALPRPRTPRPVRARLPDSEGGYLRRQNWRRRVWIPALRRAGLAYFRTYDLRHTCATLLLYDGRTVNEVA